MLRLKHFLISSSFYRVSGLLVIGLLLLFFTTGFQEQPKTIDDLIRQKVEERITAFKESSIKRCHQKALEEADRLVDSILIARARKLLIQIDTISRPVIPPKPEMPEIPKVNDSIPIAPLLKKRDSLQQIPNNKDTILQKDTLLIKEGF